MSKLPSVKNIQMQDIPGAPVWFDSFLQRLNKFMIATYDGMDKRLSINDNLQAYIHEMISFKPEYIPYKIASKLPVNVSGIIKVSCQDVTDGYTAMTNAIDVSWYSENNNIIIDNIIGLTAGHTYNIRLVYF